MTHPTSHAALAGIDLDSAARLLLDRYDELRGERAPAAEFELLRSALARSAAHAAPAHASGSDGTAAAGAASLRNPKMSDAECREKLNDYLMELLDAKDAMLARGIDRDGFAEMFAQFVAAFDANRAATSGSDETQSVKVDERALREILKITYEVGPPAGSEYFTIRELCRAALAQQAASPAPVAAHADDLAGRVVSVDVSTGEDDACNRIFAELTGETGSDGTTLLAIEIERNFAAPGKADAANAAGRPCSYVESGDHREEYEVCVVCGDTRYGGNRTKCDSAIEHLEKVGVLATSAADAKDAEQTKAKNADLLSALRAIKEWDIEGWKERGFALPTELRSRIQELLATGRKCWNCAEVSEPCYDGGTPWCMKCGVVDNPSPAIAASQKGGA